MTNFAKFYVYLHQIINDLEYGDKKGIFRVYKLKIRLKDGEFSKEDKERYYLE